MPTLQEEYDVLAGELRGLNVRLDLPEDDGISQAQPIGVEYDALAGELRGLNTRLGLPENDGIPQASSANSEYENLVRQNNALDQRLSALFPTFDEWNAEQDELDKRSNWEATKTFTDNFITGAGAMWDEGGKALDELTSGKAGWDSLGGILEVGKRDFVRFAKTMGGAAEDLLPTTESERSREYRRAKENFDYYQTVRPLMVDAVGGDAKNLVSFGAQFVDPLIFIPVAGTAAKVGAWGLKSARLGRMAAALDKVGDVVSLPSKAVAAATRKGLKGTAYVAGKAAGLVGTAGGGVAKLAALPRNLASKVAQKVLPESIAGGAGGALFTGQLVGAATGAVPFAAQLGIGEIAGFIANRTGKGIEKILTTLAAPGAQQRFLQRLAQTAESPRMRKLALWAHRKGGTKLGDVAFNSLVNGASIASINGALAYLSGESAEGIGQAAGAGMVMGGALPFGQPGQKAGKAQSSRDATSINYFEGKIAAEQVKEFRKLEPEARLVAATAEEAGIPIPKLFFVDSKMFLDLMRQDDPNAREAQSAMYDPKAKEIYVNQDISSKESSRAVMQMFTEELGHHFITEAIKTDPMFGHQILAEYKAKEGEKSHTFIFERDPDGNPLRTIEINEKGKKLADAYSSISDDVNVGIGNDANLLAQEIGAAQFSIMMDENPNLFPHLAQPIRHKLVNASQKILSLMGITDKFGNTLPLNIASKLKRSPAIRNLYRNYLKQREMHMAGKIDLAEKGQSIPLKRGESPQAGAERLFGATGLSLKDAKAFIINNKQIKRELTNLKNRYQDAPADGWSVVRGRLIGKELTPEMRVIFTRTNPDPRGSVNIIINDVQAAIADNSEVNFLFRSGKPSKYSDNELKVRVVAPVGFEISGMAGKGAATLYMQAMDIAYLKNNVEVLVQEGFIKNPDKFIAEARQVAKDAVSDPEGRINPEGKFENELITVALGNKASADFIKNPKLARLLEEGRLQHSFRQYRIGELAGIALTGRPGIGFDWYNVKRNYSPHGRNFMPRRKPNQPDDTIPLPFDELPGDKPGEGFGRMVNVDKTKSEMAEAKRLADEAQDGFSSSGNVRTPDAYGRDKLFMPAAYHGTPHTFKAEEGAPLGRFRSAQIGTGEGAQAYGHGLYFAGKKEVGEHYRKVLTDGSIKDFVKAYKDKLSKSGQTIEDGVAALKRNDMLLEARALKASPKELEQLLKGSLYKVELAPKENEYLLWDKPLSEQPKGVREKLGKMYSDQIELSRKTRESYNAKRVAAGLEPKKFSEPLGGKGARLYERLQREFDGDQAAASAALKEAGIPGIKYLDGSSRSKGKGDYNYVIFDEADVAITDKLFMPADRALGLPDNIRGEVLPGIKQDKFSRGQLEAALLKSAGSKAYAEEIGLMDWLKDRKSVTKSEVDAFVAENAPRLEEKVLEMTDPGGGPNPPKFSDYQEPGGTNYREVLIKLPTAQKLYDRKFAEIAERHGRSDNPRPYPEYATPEEAALLNSLAERAINETDDGVGLYRDPHFQEDNVLLHLRLNDRIDANGKKVLFIEELQSDWHQKGRKDGYAGQHARPYKIIEDSPTSFIIDFTDPDGSSNVHTGFESRAQAERAAQRRKDEGVPDAPFKKNWPALGLKRAIREALENGYDRVAWLDGEGQAARYDLSQQVDAIRVIRDKDGTYEIMARSADDMAELGEFQTLATKVAKEKLADYIGKEPASKALDKMKDGVAELSGLDLKVGGEGMKAFYDRELVSIANKISKKIGGGKVRRETIEMDWLRPADQPDGVQISSHVLDLPKNPQAVENLRLYMPAQKAPSDSRVPTILKDAKGRGALVQPRAIESGFGTENIDAPGFVDKVLGDLKVDVQRTNFEKPEVNLADHYGKNALITMTDRTPTDHVIYGINDVQFKTPLRLEGGRDYMFDSAHSPGAAWANEQGAMTARLNRREKLGGEDMLVIPMEMAPTSVDFPTMAPALHIRYAQVAMKAKDKRYVNSLVKKGGKGFLTKSQDQVKVPKFDIDMENVEAFLSKLSGPQRKTINNVFDMVNRPSSGQKKKGVRQIDGALSNFEMRAAISDPAMFNQKSLMQTTNVGLMTGGQAPSMHSTYNAAMKGKGLGVLKVPEGFQPKAQDFLPDLFKKSNKDYVDSSEAFTARKGVRTAKIDEALLKRLGL